MARCWWLTPVILAIQEAEIRRITVQRDHSSKPAWEIDLVSKIPNTKQSWWSGSSGGAPA
jgi:hypothetical protein